VIVGTTSRPESPLYLQKVVALAEDLVPSLGDVNAGDVMRYSLIFTNLGPTTLQNVVADDRGQRSAHGRAGRQKPVAQNTPLGRCRSMTGPRKRKRRGIGTERSSAAGNPGPPAGRRRLSKLLTTERIKAELQHLNVWLTSLDHRLPPPKDEDERCRRAVILNEMLMHLLVGCLVTVKEFMPSYYRALAVAASGFRETKLASGQGVFTVRHVRARGGLFETVRLMMLVALHDGIKARLQPVWRQEPRVDDRVRSPRFVSRTGRYGERQYRGNQRRLAMDRSRAAALQTAIQELTQGNVPIDTSTALRMVRHSKGPADVSLAFLGTLTKQPKRSVKALVIEGRKRMVEGAKIRAALSQRGYVTVEALRARRAADQSSPPTAP
jgi:hypothetical protein